MLAGYSTRRSRRSRSRSSADPGGADRGGGKVAMGFVEIMLGVWRCDEGYDCTVLGQGSDRAENVINSNAIERKFSLDI
jgi:hypothetical protein